MFFGFLAVIFLFSLFVNINRKDEGLNSDVRHPYPQEIQAVQDSLLEFLDSVDSTLNILRNDLKIKSYGVDK